MKMGKIKYLLAALTILLFCEDLSAQFKVYTRKTRLADFPAKTTMIVLTGDEILDIALRSEIKSRWRISPYDFCEESQMDAIKSNPSFYILYLSEEKSGVIFLNLEKCGDKKGISSLESRMDVIKVPFCPKDFSSGREVLYVSAMIDVMQHYVEGSLLHSQGAYKNLEQSRIPLAKERRKALYINRDDLSGIITSRDSIISPGNGLVFTDSYTADSLFTSGSQNALIGFCISSSAPGPKAESYQIIVTADRHELLYYKKNRYGKEADRGFTLKSLAVIQAEHSYKK